MSKKQIHTEELGCETSNKEPDVCKLFTGSPEGHIFLVGVSLFLAFLIWVSLGWLWSEEYYRKILSLAGTRLVIGRPGGVYFGYAIGAGHVLNFLINSLVDTIGVFLMFPLVAVSHQRIKIVPLIRGPLDRISRIAESNSDSVQRWGILGLFLFVVFPLWGTGPVVGSAIGIIMGLRPWFNMGVVLSATYLAVALWAILLTRFHERVLAYNPNSPMILIGVLFILAIGMFLFRLAKGKKHHVA